MKLVHIIADTAERARENRDAFILYTFFTFYHTHAQLLQNLSSFSRALTNSRGISQFIRFPNFLQPN